MSDMEDDFMCDDEEDYDLVLKSEFILRAFTHMSLEHSSWSTGLATVSCQLACVLGASLLS